MTEIVTAKNRYDFEPFVKAIERALSYSECLDEMEHLRLAKGGLGTPKASTLTAVLADAMSIIHDIRADEHEDSYDKEFGSDFATKVEVTDE